MWKLANSFSKVNMSSLLFRRLFTGTIYNSIADPDIVFMHITKSLKDYMNINQNATDDSLSFETSSLLAY